jgi:hypothetical protein
MALDLSKIKARLEGLKGNSAKNTSLWKPKPGKNLVRIVPYSHNTDNPFIELFFHYGMNNKTYISPTSFGRPDPIVEFANQLKKGDKESWKRGRALEPKMRTYVPVLVRGEEDEGVKFWGMGKQVYQEILGIIADPDYGDITDLKNGRDVTVDFKTAQECGKEYPETSVRVKPNVSMAFDPSNKSTLEKVKNQKVVGEMWPELSYEELADIMDTWLNAPDETSVDSVGSDDFSGANNEEPVVKSATQKIASVKEPATTAKGISDEFEDLFNS